MRRTKYAMPSNRCNLACSHPKSPLENNNKREQIVQTRRKDMNSEMRRWENE